MAVGLFSSFQYVGNITTSHKLELRLDYELDVAMEPFRRRR